MNTFLRVIKQIGISFVVHKVCEKYREGGWLVKKVPNQGTYMTKGFEWISFYTPQDMKEKVKWIEESGMSIHAFLTLDVVNLVKSLFKHVVKNTCIEGRMRQKCGPWQICIS